MPLPGFTAEITLTATRTRVQRRPVRRAASAVVSAQLQRGAFQVPVGGLSFGSPEWQCARACETAYADCLNACEGDLVIRRPSRNCWVCDTHYRDCMQGCFGSIA